MRALILLFALLTTSAWGQTVKTNSEKLKDFYFNLNKNTLNLVDEFYHPQADFADPIGKMKGAQALRKYYGNLYENVKEVRFEFKEIIESDNRVVAVWLMYLKTDKLNGGEIFTVEGNSVVHFDSNGMAIYHRDYFDMGEFIYERLPVIGFVVRKIRARMSEH